MVHRWRAGALLWLCWLASAPALAQTSAQDRATARLLAEEADKKLEAGDAKGALELFQRADAIYPAPTLKLATARALLLLGQFIEAHELLLDVSRSEPQKNEPPPWSAARDSARAEAEAVAPKIPRIEILLENIDPADPTLVVMLDGRRLPRASFGVVRPINPGKHLVHAEARGFIPTDQKIQMGEGEHYKLTLKLFPEAAAPGSTARAPAARASARPAAEPGSKALAIAGFSGAGVMAGVGSVLGLMVLSRVNDIKKDCTLPPANACPQSRRADADRAGTLATASNVAFALSAVGLGVGIVGLLTGPGDRPKNESVRLTVGPGGVGVGGQF